MVLSEKILKDLKNMKKKEGSFILYNKKGDKIASGDNKNDVLNYIKENFEVDKEGEAYGIIYTIDEKYNPESKVKFGPFSVGISKLILTPNYKLKNLNQGQVIYYTDEELKNIGFKKEHIKKIIDSVDKKKISFIPFSKVTITDILQQEPQQEKKNELINWGSVNLELPYELRFKDKKGKTKLISTLTNSGNIAKKEGKKSIILSTHDKNEVILKPSELVNNRYIWNEPEIIIPDEMAVTKQLKKKVVKKVKPTLTKTGNLATYKKEKAIKIKLGSNKKFDIIDIGSISKI